MKHVFRFFSVSCKRTYDLSPLQRQISFRVTKFFIADSYHQNPQQSSYITARMFSDHNRECIKSSIQLISSWTTSWEHYVQ